VSARAFLDIVKMLPGPNLNLTCLPNQHLSIKSGRTNARLVALAADEFPRLPDTKGAEFSRLSVADFSYAINKTLYSTSSDENRYNLTGVFLDPKQPSILVSTDGHRLSYVEINLSPEPLKFKNPVILPRKGLIEIMRLLDGLENDTKNTFEFAILGNQAMVIAQNTVLTMRLIDGKFPDYQQVIPKLSDKIMRVSRNDILLGLKRVSVLSNDKTQSARLKLAKGDLTVSCVNPETGEASDAVAVEYNGPDIEIGFNAKYIIDALSSLGEDSVMMKFTDPLSPALLTGITTENHLCVIMPMRM
ncbi:MAG: DNA polymerase III subunit beta, partial [Proteobacteria bacterium]|nr:DNA polymerase III subunit beta [Pseudomonadota bacterium]